MNIHLPLLSILSLAFLVFFSFFGDVELYSLDIGVQVASGSAEITIDPTWAIWVPRDIVRMSGGNAFACGNVMVLDRRERDSVCEEYVLAHESNHVEQFRALGFLVYPAQFFLDIESPAGMTMNWDDLAQPDRTMWLPPASLADQWHFVTLSLD